MQRFGDDEAGFSLADSDDPIRLVAWGFWSTEIAAAFAGALVNLGRARSATSMVLDATKLKPQRDEGQHALAQLMSSLVKLGITSVQVLTTSQLTKLQLLRLAGEASVKERLSFAPTPLEPPAKKRMP